ncbi:DUF1566 domain-containing protein [Planctomycetota bacterium]
MKTLQWLVLGGCLVLASPGFGYEALQGPTETGYWNAEQAYNGYTLFGARGGTYLIDMEGRVVRTWSSMRTNPRFLENGNILDSSTDDPSRGGGFIEVDWDDQVVWSYTDTRSDYALHHDFVRIFNKQLGAYTTLYIANRSITQDQCLAAGCDPSRKYNGAQMDAIVEVDMDGNIVWEWWFFDHVVQDVDPTKENYVGEGKTIADYPGRIDLNLPGRPVKRDWLHCNSLDYNAELGHIVTNSVQGEFYVIDHDGTFVTGDPSASISLAASEAGDFLYRFGDPARYEQGDIPSFLEDWTQLSMGHKQLGGAHDVQWIKPGLPGAGNLFVFNNGQYIYDRTCQSYAVEINPFLNSKGQKSATYVNPPDAGYFQWKPENKDTHKQKRWISNQIVWEYGSLSHQGFFSHIGSGCQRLPNGNTLICAMAEGHLLEVTLDGDLVWEYINPINTDGIKTVNVDQYPMNNAMFRAYRYDANHPAFKGRDLTPGETLTGTEPAYTSPSTQTVSGRISNSPMFDMKSDVASTLDPLASTSRGGAAIFLSTEVAEPTVARLLPDTGQQDDYTTTWGEDSDFQINSPEYQDLGDGVVRDEVTGLVWQQIDGGPMTWEEAGAYATALELGGYTDWRLPSPTELFGLMHHGLPDPAIDTSVFPRGKAQYWWTSTARVDDPSRVWVVNGGGGLGAHRKTEATAAGGQLRIHTRCVRGTLSAVSSWQDMSANTVTDTTTGLTWQTTPDSETKTWEQALNYANTLDLNGTNDWRLPNLKELQSIVDMTRSQPALNTTVFQIFDTKPRWTSTSLAGHGERAWTVDFRLGTVSYADKTEPLPVLYVRSQDSMPPMKTILGGSYLMGDHHDLGGAEHRNDEVPVHRVTLDSFLIGVYEITNTEYVAFLNGAMNADRIVVDNGLVYHQQADALLCDTYQSDGYSRIVYEQGVFYVSPDKENHPVVGIRWLGAIAYCNWLSEQVGFSPCYDLETQQCDFSQNGFRLPTEAEWEYAGRGGLYEPYTIYPWGDDADYDKANWPNSGDPYETGPLPYTTPVGFYDGQLKDKADYSWPSSTASYQTHNGINGYGLCDMAGNVWEWTNDWYTSDYYAISPERNPLGPEDGKPMPDGKIYHVLRSGNWYNGPEGHSRVSNRNPAHFRGPQDPDHPWYHIGFRIARGSVSEGSQPPQLPSDRTDPSASELRLIEDGFQFAEGPAANDKGEIYFSDLQASIIYKLNDKGRVKVFLDNSGGANGLLFDHNNNLIACQGDLGRLVSIDQQNSITVLADTYQGRRFNKPNDLWIDPAGGIYFSDPAYGTKPVQDGEHVYYLAPDRRTLTRAIDTMVRPNGLVGTPDGKTLYVADHGAGRVYRYAIQPNASLNNRSLFVAKACDGMTIDDQGNVYITNEGNVLVYTPAGELIETIAVGGQVTNVCFGGSQRNTLYITRTNALYAVDMLVSGVR